jgi:hypothetical protein
VRTASLALLGLAAPLAAASEWRFEAATGTAHSFASSLTLELARRPETQLDADWETHPFDGAIYYSLRVSRFERGGGWEIQLLHHKLYLANPSPPVGRFEVSHGYNLVTVARALERGGFTGRLGVGVVVAHPETVIDGQPQPADQSGYVLTGPAFVLGAGRSFDLGRRAFLEGELGFSFAWARVPVAGGHAGVPNRAVHALVGLGVRF